MARRYSNSKADDILTDMCDKHRSRIIELYCIDCDRVGCLQCIEDNHNNCDTVCIPDYTKNADKMLKEDAKKVPTFNSRVFGQTPIEEELEKVEHYKWITKMHSQNTHEQVKLHRKVLNNALDKIETNTHMMVDGKTNNTLEALEEYTQRLNLTQIKHEQVKSSNSRTRNSDDINKAFVNKKLLSESIANFTSMKQEMDTKLDNHARFCFQPSRTLAPILTDEILLGSIEKLPKKDGKKYLKYNSIIKTGCFNKFYPNFDSKKTTMVDICIILSNGMLLLRSHIIYVASTLLFLCDIETKEDKDLAEFKVLYKIDTKNYFHTMTKVDDTRVLITLYDKKQLQFVHIYDEKIELGERLNVSDECTGIGCLQDKLFVYLEKPKIIEILDLEGHVLKKVSFVGSQLHKDFHLKGRATIICDPKRKRVYVLDQFNDCIIVLDEEGVMTAVVWNNPDFYKTRMKEPMTACIGEEGEIYVAVNYPYSIQKISPNLLEREYLAVKGPTWEICSVACHNNKIYFGNRGGDFYIAEISTYA